MKVLEMKTSRGAGHKVNLIKPGRKYIPSRVLQGNWYLRKAKPYLVVSGHELLCIRKRRVNLRAEALGFKAPAHSPLYSEQPWAQPKMLECMP